MEILFNEKINYGIITPYRNYSLLVNKEKYKERYRIINRKDKDLFSMERIVHLNHEHYLPQKINVKKDTYFFYSPDGDDNYGIILDGYIKARHKNTFITFSGEKIKKYYNDPFSEVTICTIERRIVKKDDKVTIKLYKHIKQRNLNRKFFQKTTRVSSLTVNLKTSNFYTLEYQVVGKNKKKVTIIRQNSFNALKKILNDKSFSFFDVVSSSPNSKIDSNVKSIFEDTFNNIKFSQEVNKLLGIDYKFYEQQTFIKSFIKKFVEIKNIKVPNDFHGLVMNFYPTEKSLKKNGRKLIASVLDSLGMKNKTLIKILHQYPNVDLKILNFLYFILDDDHNYYLSLVDFSKLKSAKEYTKYDCEFRKNSFNYDLTKKEKRNIIEIINSLNDSDSRLAIIHLLIDHFRIIHELDAFGEKLFLESKNYDQFHFEHLEYTKLLKTLRKGWSTIYMFHNEFVEEIENQTYINVEGDKFEAVILKREEDFIEEGDYMHHCVSSYVEKNTSVIISVRKINHKDRVTCEYEIQTGRNIQSRHFCNQIPPTEFNDIIETIDKKVKQLAKLNKLAPTDKKKINVKKVNMDFTYPELPF